MAHPAIAPRLTAATRGSRLPAAVVDLDAFDRNASTLVGMAHGKPIRVATKSLRVRTLIERALERPGFRGLMCYSLEEALIWARAGHGHILVAYPTVDVPALHQLGEDPALVAAVTVMIDSVEHVDFLGRHLPRSTGLRVAIDVDASLRVGPAHLGVRRSPTRTPEEVAAVIRRARSHGIEVVGLMVYDAQIAGVPDTTATRPMKARSHRELTTRRREIVETARELADLEFVNGGGTGSLARTGADESLTEVAAGSGLFAPTLFDHYDRLPLEPAALFALPVVRRPAPDVVTVFSGGYVASGPPGWGRVPSPLPEQDLRLLRTEGAGEVQTPLRGPGARRLHLGAPVWFRHAKAGELAERFNEVLLVSRGALVGTTPTYRGEGLSFG
jgi:D-serine deaminase-like pyridoxal phosphate-dependent protein